MLKAYVYLYSNGLWLFCFYSYILCRFVSWFKLRCEDWRRWDNNERKQKKYISTRNIQSMILRTHIIIGNNVRRWTFTHNSFKEGEQPARLKNLSPSSIFDFVRDENSARWNSEHCEYSHITCLYIYKQVTFHFLCIYVVCRSDSWSTEWSSQWRVEKLCSFGRYYFLWITFLLPLERQREREREKKNIEKNWQEMGEWKRDNAAYMWFENVTHMFVLSS